MVHCFKRVLNARLECLTLEKSVSLSYVFLRILIKMFRVMLRSCLHAYHGTSTVPKPRTNAMDTFGANKSALGPWVIMNMKTTDYSINSKYYEIGEQGYDDQASQHDIVSSWFRLTRRDSVQ